MDTHSNDEKSHAMIDSNERTSRFRRRRINRKARYMQSPANSTRLTGGQALVEGVVGLWLVVLGIVVGVLLLLNVGTFLLYETKLSYIAGYVATMAANEEQSPFYVDDATTKAHAQANATKMCTDMNIPGTPKVTTVITQGSAPTPGTITVNISMGAGGFTFRELSGVIALTLQSNAEALIDPTRPKYCAYIEECINTAGCYSFVPAYGVGSFSGATSINHFLGQAPNAIVNIDSFGQGTLYSDPQHTSILFNCYPTLFGGPADGIGCSMPNPKGISQVGFVPVY